MRKSMKQFLSLVLVVAMVLSLGVLPASAAGLDDEDVDIVAITEPVAEEPAREVDEVNYPAQQFSYYEPNGLNIEVKAPAGALPRGTTMEVSRLEDLARVQNAVNRAEDLEGSVVLAADISFWNEGKEIEPVEGNKILVTMSAPEIAEIDNPVVVHVPDEEPAVAEVIDPLPDEDLNTVQMADQISFEAESFSVYAVVGEGEETDDSRVLVRFYHHDTDPANNVDPVYSVYVKQRDIDDLGTIIEDPQVPNTTGNELFCGWYINEDDYTSADYTAADVDGHHTIDWVREVIRTRLGSSVAEGEDVVNVFAMVFNYFNVAYVDENGETTLATDVYYSKEASITVDVQLTYAPYLQGYRFLGWQKDDGDDTVYTNGQTAEVTQQVTKFRAMVQQGFWLSFEENPGEHYKGASYVPPVFCPNGVIPANAQPTDPTLKGYTLGDASGKWFTSFEKGATAAEDVWSNPFSFSGTLTQDTTVYAKWVLEDEVNFTIIVWKQNIGDDRNAADSAKTYDFAFSRTKTVAPNTPIADLVNISSADVQRYTELSGKSSVTVDGTRHNFYGFTYNETKGVSSSDTVVKPDGTTVVNLYYDRDLMTITFMTQEYTAVSGHPSTYSGTPVYYIYYNNQYCPIRYNNSSSNNIYVTTTSNSGTQYAVVDGAWTQLTYRQNTNTGVYGWYYAGSDNRYYAWEGTRYAYSTSRSTTSYTYYTRDWAQRDQFTGLYDQKLSEYGYTWPNDYRWMNDDPNGSTFTSVMDCFSNTVLLYGVEKQFDANVYHFLQDENGNYKTAEADADFTIPCKTSDGMVFRSFSGFSSGQYRVKLPSGVTTYQYATSYTTSGSGDDTTYTFTWSSNQRRIYDSAEGGYWTDWIDAGVAIQYNGFEPDDISHITPVGAKIEFRYERVKKPITYMYGAFVTGRNVAMPAQYNGQLKQTDPIFFQASVDSYKVGGTNYYDPVVAGDFNDDSFIFEGWFVDPGCTTAYDFTGKTMLQGGITVYAKFRQIEYRVFLYVNEEGKEWEDVEWNDPDQASNFRIAYDGVISEGNPIEGSMEGYVLVGWYTDEACTEPFNFQTKFTEAMGDLLLTYGAAEKADPQYYTDYYDDNGNPLNPPINKDVNRPWINQMVHLYAKWRKVLPGSTGITVVYDAVEKNDEGEIVRTGTLIGTDGSTSTTYTDPLRYTDKSDALSHSASTPDDSSYQFLYWQILDKQGNPVPSDQGGIVYPGMTFTVKEEYAVVTDAPSAGTTSVGDGLISVIGGDAAAPMATGSANPVRAATDVYTQVTTPVIGHSYLMGYVSGSTVYLIGNTTYYSDGTCPSAVSATVSGGEITGEYSAYTWAVGGSSSALTFQNATAGYLARSGSYLAFGTSNNTWTYTNNKLVNTAGGTYPNVGYYSSGYFDVYRSNGGSNITFFELVETGEPVTYTKVETPVPGISYVIAQDSVNYAVSGEVITNNNSYLGAVQIERSGNTVTIYDSQVAELTWTAGGDATNGWTWKNVGTGNYMAVVNGYLNTSATAQTWNYGSNHYFENTSTTSSWKYLGFNSTYSDYDTYQSGNAIGIYALTHTLTVNYVMSDGSTAPAAYVGTVPEGVAYTVNSPEVEGYTADQITVSGTMGTSDVTVTVTYTVNSHTVTFNWHGGSSTQTVDDGDYATAPANPGDYTENGVRYIFTRWDPDPENTPITSDQIFTAQYKREGAFIVTFKDWNGRVLKTEEVMRGGDATPPADPTREGFTFKGWDKDYTDVQSDLVIYATYATQVTKIYTVTLRAVYGPKSIQRPTHIVWYANNGSGDYAESAAVKINGNIQIPLPAGDTNNPYISWQGEEDLVWEDHEFLGWARVAESDMEGDQYWSSADNHPEQLELTEDDLFLRYNPDTKTFSAATTVSTTVDRPTMSQEYVLFGYIGGRNYSCEQNSAEASEYVFNEYGELETTLPGEGFAYVSVKVSDGSTWYMTNGYPDDATSATLYDTTTPGINADKLKVPAGVQVTFVLQENKDGTLTLSYRLGGNTVSSVGDLNTRAAGETTWIDVSYVAPDELMPYHAMYAVWGKVVYVYHSGDNTIEKITVPNDTTLDIANHVTSGFLYGGFYTDYAGTTIKNILPTDDEDTVNNKRAALNALGWNPVQPAEGTINATTGEPTESATVFDILASKGYVKKAQVAVGGDVKNYDGTSATAVWDLDTAYTADSEVGNGLTLSPVPGTIYYIKEVPADEFLQPRLRYTYQLGTGAIATAWLFTNTDDANYGDVGFVFDRGNNTVAKAVGDKSRTEFEVSPINKTSNAVTYFIGEPQQEESATYKRLFPKAGTMSYRLVYTNLDLYPENQDDYPDLEYVEVNDLEVGKAVYMFWVTPDNLIVTSTTSRVYGSLNNSSIGSATTKPARVSTVEVYVAPESGT